MIKVKVIIIIVLLPYLSFSQFNKRFNSCSDSFDRVKARFIILGENHWMKGNTEIAFDLFKNLYYTNGTRVFVFERGYSEIYLVDRLINQNDSSICTLFIDSYYKKLYDSLYYFNKKLDNNSKIRLIGVNEESYNQYTFLALYLLFKDVSYQNEIFETFFLEYKKAYMTNNQDVILEKMLNIRGDLLVDSTKYKNCMNEIEYYTMKSILNSYFFRTKGDLNRLDDNSLLAERNDRENFMFQNLLCFDNLLKNAKYFGYFGKLHISLDNKEWIGQKNWESFAYKINANQRFKNEVISFNIIYRSSGSIFSHFNKSKNYYKFNSKYLSRKSLEGIKQDYFEKTCPYVTIDGAKYNDTKNFNYIILNNYRQW